MTRVEVSLDSISQSRRMLESKEPLLLLVQSHLLLGSAELLLVLALRSPSGVAG
jgi:hypothetical protein